MNAVPSVELIESREIGNFIPVLREVDLGDRFLLSMLHWCGIGQRAKPLAYWRVMLIRQNAEYIGVCGLYRPVDEIESVLWLGWFGLRPAFRNNGIGGIVLDHLRVSARNLGASSLKVFADGNNTDTLRFYEKHGFAVLGSGQVFAPDQGTTPGDVVLFLELIEKHE